MFACEILVKKPLTRLRDQGVVIFFIDDMLIYRHWEILAYVVKLSDITALGEMWSLLHKKANIAFALA